MPLEGHVVHLSLINHQMCIVRHRTGSLAGPAVGLKGPRSANRGALFFGPNASE